MRPIDSIFVQTIMIGRMMKDLMGFCLFVLLMIMGFGVAIQAIQFPVEPFDFRTLIQVIYRFGGASHIFLYILIELIHKRPYFQIFGNLYLDVMQAESGCVGPWDFSSCGTSRSWLVPVLVGIYLMITNILLVNLLIAIFNATV